MTDHHSTALRLAGVALAGFGGMALAVQARVNGELSRRLDDGLLAGLLSISVGTVLLLVALPFLPAARAGMRRVRDGLRGRRLRLWECTGGMCGAILVATQGLTVGFLGVAVFTVAVVAGQLVSSLPVDGVGVGPAGPQPVTVARAVGAGLAVGAVAISVSGHPVAVSGGLWWALLPAVAGMGLAWQVATNGRVRVVARNVVAPTLVNFAVGNTTAALFVVVDVLVRGLPEVPPADWWLYLGGPLGIVAVVTAVTAVRLTGVLLLGLSAVAGQLVGAVLIDLVDDQLTAAGVLGAGLTMIAVGMAATPARRR